MTGYNLTIAEWFQSIITPQDSEPRPLRGRLKGLARMSKGLAKQNLTLKGPVASQALSHRNKTGYVIYFKNLATRL